MDQIVKKLNRIEGQVRGIRKMYEEGRDCLEVAQQVVAARQALAGIGRDLLTDEAAKCSSCKNTKADFEKILKTLFEVS